MGLQIDCGCFGPGEALGPKTLARDFSMLVLAVAVTGGVVPDEEHARCRQHGIAGNRIEYEMKMRRIFAMLPVVALAASLSAQTPKVAVTQVGAPKAAPAPPAFTARPAGEFAIHMTDGSQKLLSSYRGKFVVMAFMFTTCTHCQHTAGILAKIQNEYGSKGVQVLGVTIDPGAKDGIPTFLKITGANFPVGFSDPAPRR